jgi:hypothetical protein
MDIGTLSWLVTIIVFGALGWFIASRVRRSVGPWVYAVLLAVVIGGYFVGVDTRLLDAGGFKVSLNWAIVSCALGSGLGLMSRRFRSRRIENA